LLNSLNIFFSPAFAYLMMLQQFAQQT